MAILDKHFWAVARAAVV